MYASSDEDDPDANVIVLLVPAVAVPVIKVSSDPDIDLADPPLVSAILKVSVVD